MSDLEKMVWAAAFVRSLSERESRPDAPVSGKQLANDAAQDADRAVVLYQLTVHP